MTKFTEIYNEYKPQIEKLNKQFKKLQKHTQDLSYTNLKLHDIAFYVGDNEKLLNHFRNFCEFEYEYFEEYLQAYYKEIKAVKRAYKWLEDYKKYQVESFKDFVKNNEF